MKRTLISLVLSVLTLCPLVSSAERNTSIQLVSPADGETVYMPHPHFRWGRLPGTRLEDAHQIQIARDSDFTTIEVDDSLEVVSRFVSVKPLSAGTYFWRVRKVGSNQWSEVISFRLSESKIFQVKKGATSEDISAIIKEAAKNTPAKVLFEKGEYRIRKHVHFRETKDLIIDGGGSTFSLDDEFLYFSFCANITVQNMTVKPTVDAGTHIDIVDVNAASRTVTVKAKKGFPQDVSQYFTPGKGAGLMRCVDFENPGKAVRYSSVSMSDPSISITGPDAAGNYTFHNVKETTFRGIKPGMTGALVKYSYGLVVSQFTKKVTLSRVTLLGTGGAALHGTDNSANSYLSCRFLPRTEQHFLGGQGFITGGITGMWIENCEFKYLPDDNMAVQSLKMSLAGIEDDNIAVLAHHPWVSEIRKGDEVLLWHVETNKTATVKVLETFTADDGPVPAGDLENRRPGKLRLAKSAAELNADLGRPAEASFKGMLLFRYSPNNEDFVHRRNHVLGGSAGVMFNGKRGLIADNFVKNTRGSGIVAGYHSPNENSGYGARDVLVKDNVLENCGGSGIQVRSTANVGGNIILKNNTIIHTDIENGFLLASVQVFNDCDNVIAKDNVFRSTVKPDRGGWIATRDNSFGVRHSGNKVISPHADVPMLREF